MSKSITPAAAVPFLARGITTPEGKSLDAEMMPLGRGFNRCHHYCMSILDKQGNFLFPAPENIKGTPSYRRIIFVPQYQDNDPVRGEITLW